MLESDLVENINNYLKRKGVRFTNEIRMGIGIPDISFNLGANIRMTPVDNYFLISIFSFINERQQASFSEIKEAFQFSSEKVRKYVFELANLCLVEVKNKVIKIIKNIFNYKLGVTFSIEAKLKDWKEAFIQAQRYQYFSDYSYAALPKDRIKNIDFNLYAKSGIGVLAIDGKTVDEVLPPIKSSKCNNIQKYICTSKVIENSFKIKKRQLKSNIFTSYI